MTRRASAATLAALVIAAAGCGGDDDPKPAPGAGASGQSAPGRSAATSDARVIRRWSDLLRRGQVDDASALFAVPATVANGTGPIRLGSPPEVRAFNDSLPCGARLLSTTRRAPYTVGTFELTGLPGGDCGPGTGEKAATAFRIEHGRIVEWLRVPVPPDTPKPEPPRPPSDRVSPDPAV